MFDKITTIFNKFVTLQAVKNGLVMMIPVLMLGSLSLIVLNFSYAPYQQFIQSDSGHYLKTIMFWIYSATYSFISIYITLSISLCLSTAKGKDIMNTILAALASIANFVILNANSETNTFDTTFFGDKGMFIAIVTAIATHYLLGVFSRFFNNLFKGGSFSTNVYFSYSLKLILPVAATSLFFVTLHYVLVNFLDIKSIPDLFINLVNRMFENLGRNFFGGLLFVFLSSFFWFFGLHGAHMLDNVAKTLFAFEAEPEILTGGLEFLNKGFFDVYIYMGGSSMSFALLISILFFAKTISSKKIARLSIFPVLFNINELIIFGLPIVYNIYFLIPFVLVPVVAFTTSYIAVNFGIIAPVINEVHWTMPPLISGYYATESFSGVFLQLINLTIGILIYTPFLKAFDKSKFKTTQERLYALQDELLAAQKEQEDYMIKYSPYRDIGISLAFDLRNDINNNMFELYYQPQVNADNVCIGAEALLRWKHPQYGMIIPPLIIKIAEEEDMLEDLEKSIIEISVAFLHEHREVLGDKFKMSANITVETCSAPDFKFFIEYLAEKYDLQPKSLCLEITENSAFNKSTNIETLIEELSSKGIMLAIDDFSMGFTSLKYLQAAPFDMVKLDGEIVKELMDNDRVKEIVSSIVYLSHSLNFIVVAEYVETAEMIETLKELEVTIYQGYHFGKAEPGSVFLEFYTKFNETPYN